MTRRLQTIIFLIVVVIALAVGWTVAGEIEGFDENEICQSEHGPGWTYVDGPEDRGIYCQAPNGSVHLTIIDMGGPMWSIEDFAVFLAVSVGAIGVGWLTRKTNNSEAEDSV